MMSLLDTSLRRESNCPVHFVWDGNGLGRPVVRVGFLLLVVTGLLMMAAIMSHSAVVKEAGFATAVVAAVVWGAGQALTRFSLLRARSSFRRAR